MSSSVKCHKVVGILKQTTNWEQRPLIVDVNCFIMKIEIYFIFL